MDAWYGSVGFDMRDLCVPTQRTKERKKERIEGEGRGGEKGKGGWYFFFFFLFSGVKRYEVTYVRVCRIYLFKKKGGGVGLNLTVSSIVSSRPSRHTD